MTVAGMVSLALRRPPTGVGGGRSAGPADPRFSQRFGS